MLNEIQQKELNKILARIKKLKKRVEAGKKLAKAQLETAKKDLTFFKLKN